MAGRFGAGELRRERLPGRDGRVELRRLLLGEAGADAVEHLGHAPIERILRGEALPGRAGLGVLGVLLQVVGLGQLRVEDGPLRVGRLRPVGELGQIALIGRDRRVKLALGLEDLADLEGGRHAPLGQIAAGGVGFGLEQIPLQERLVRIEGLLRAAAGLLGGGDLEGGADRQRVGRISLEEPLQGGDAQIELGVVGRVRHAEGARDLEHGPRVGVAPVLARG